MKTPTIEPTHTRADSAHELAGEYSKPVPTKFLTRERAILSEAKRVTGYSNSELIRRAVRLLGRQREVVNDYGFLVSLSPQ
jgi:hypothetical protein